MFDATLLNPSGGTVNSSLAVGSSGHEFDSLLPSTGTYTIVIDARIPYTGSVTLTLSNDLTDTITVGGSPVDVEIDRVGQNSRVTFSGSANERVGLGFSSVTGGLVFDATLLDPSGGTVNSALAVGSSGHEFDSLLPSSGTYTIVIDARIAYTGSVGLTLSDDLVIDAEAGVPSVLEPRSGENLRFVFAAQAGTQLKLTARENTIGCCPPVKLLNSSGSQVGSAGSLSAGDTSWTVPTLPSTGDYTVFVDMPAKEAMSARITLSGTLAPAQSYGCGAGAHANAATVCAADPVNTLTGAFTSTATDLTLAATGVPFEFTRSYTSADTTTGRLGPGWTDNYAVSLAIQGNGDAILHGDEGQQLLYTKQADGSFVGALGGRSTLTLSGGVYTLTRTDQVAYTFNSSGVLQTIVDRNGQGLDFAYNGSGQLETITDSASNEITLTYTSGLVSSVATPDDRTVSYGYTSGRLTSVTLPD